MQVHRTLRRQRGRLLTVGILFLVLAAAAGVAFGYAPGGIAATDPQVVTAGPRGDAPPAMSSHPRTDTITFDVAESGARFVFDEAPVDGEGLPAYGNAFITGGTIFQSGTLDGDREVVNEDGTVKPEYQDKAIGTWRCYGYFVGDGAQTEPGDGPWVVTTQLYDFGDGDTLVSIGEENPVGGPAAVRAITGGTGDHRVAGGQISQQAFALNASGGVNARFTAEVATPLVLPGVLGGGRFGG